MRKHDHRHEHTHFLNKREPNSYTKNRLQEMWQSIEHRIIAIEINKRYKCYTKQQMHSYFGTIYLENYAMNDYYSCQWQRSNDILFFQLILKQLYVFKEEIWKLWEYCQI